MAKKLTGVRKHIVTLDRALFVASTLANSAPDGSRTVRIWGRAVAGSNRSTERYSVLDLSETPKGKGWAPVYELKRVGED